MKRDVRVHLLPGLFEPQELRGEIAVVIDALRATTTIAYALAAGAAKVIPCGEVDEARQLAAGLPSGTAILGGERGGLKIPGFDLGNSPTEYSPAVVAGKSVVFTTTNGTRALLRAREARRIVTAALANLNAVVHWLARQTGAVHLICAGTDRQVTLEDVLCAGAIAKGLSLVVPGIDLSDDSTALALELYETRWTDYDRLIATLRESRGGRNLVEHGLDVDIEITAICDAASLVPELSRDPWQITAAADAVPSHHPVIEPPRALRA